MSDERLIVVSADCHAGPDTMADYRGYLDPKYRADFDDYIAQVDAYEANYQDGRTHGGAAAREGDEGLWDFAERTRYLDADGISAELIYIQGGIPFGPYPAISGRDRMMDYTATPAQVAVGCRAYNRWLADLCSTNPVRHIGIARIPVPDIPAAVAEVEFAAKAGLKGGVLLPPLSTPDIPYYNESLYEPLWAECEANGMTLNLHGGANVYYGGGVERLALKLVEGDWFCHRGITHLIFSGVFERHPKLHLAATEQRTHWAAPLLKECDSIYDWAGNAVLRKVLPKRPSEYFKTNCFIGASFMSRLECAARGDVGADKLMWGSDYPHQEGTWPYTDISLRWTFGCDVSSSDLRAMLGENAARCYNLDLKPLRAIADRIGPRESALRVPVEKLPTHDPSGGYLPSWAFREAGPWH
jgi:predicted TIM-barrel fold metal-dependent hydrolase